MFKLGKQQKIAGMLLQVFGKKKKKKNKQTNKVYVRKIKSIENKSIGRFVHLFFYIYNSQFLRHNEFVAQLTYHVLLCCYVDTATK